MRNLTSVVALAAALSFAAAAAPITDEESAIAEARKYTKGRCPPETPCNFKPRREGKQWNVWVEFTKRHARGEKPRPYHGGHVILYFDSEGRLVKRIEGQ